MEQWEEARRRDERFQRRVNTSNYVNIKTNDDNVNNDADDNGAVGGGSAAKQTKATTRPNRQIH
jgi:hypothetical protein